MKDMRVVATEILNVYINFEYDVESGLYYFRARYYSPFTGTFISPDPIGFAGRDFNLYGYVRNNPINFIDSTGLVIEDRTFGLIPRFIKNSALYRKLDASPEIIIIEIDNNIGGLGETIFYPQNKRLQVIKINVNRHPNPDEINETIIHEFNHADLNLKYDARTSETFDTDVILPGVRRATGLNSCGL